VYRSAPALDNGRSKIHRLTRARTIPYNRAVPVST
jgi:hypothetical protein